METQVSMDDKIRSTFGKALLEALSENTRSGKSHIAAPAKTASLKVTEKRYNIMLVNLEGYPQNFSALNRTELDQLQKDFFSIAESAAAAHRGSIVKNTDSACLITFDAPTDVLRAGLKIESTLFRYNKENDPIKVKIVINTDEVVSEEWSELFKKFMNRVIQKEKISQAPSEKAEETSRISAKREVSWGSKMEKPEAPVKTGEPMQAPSVAAEATTKTIMERRLPNAPRTSVKVVTHKRELPEGAQQFTPHFIHAGKPRKMEEPADWSHRTFVFAVLVILLSGGVFILRIINRHFGDNLAPVKSSLSGSASFASAFIQSKFFSSAKPAVIAPLAETPVSQAAAPAPATPVTSASAAPAAPARSTVSPAAPSVPAVSVVASPASVPAAQAPAAAPAAEAQAPAVAKPGIPRFDNAALQKQFADEAEVSAERIARYRAVLRYYPDTKESLLSQLEIGKARVQIGQYELAKDMLNELINKAPLNETAIFAESYYQLGTAYFKQGDMASAKWCFEKIGKSYSGAAHQVKEAQKMLDTIKQQGPARR